jgi:hypothetical protein
MSGAREIIGDNKKKKSSPWFAWFGGAFGRGKEYSLMGWTIARHVAWFVVTVGMITAVPLILEV